MLFRKAEESDIGRIMEVIAEARDSLACLGIDQWQRGYPTREVFATDCARGESYVAVEEGGTVLATVAVTFGEDPEFEQLEGGAWRADAVRDRAEGAARYAVIHRVAACKASKGTGAASTLMAGAEGLARAHACTSLRVCTHAGNAPMIRLLERHGYERCGDVRIDHADGGDPVRAAYEKLL